MIKSFVVKNWYGFFSMYLEKQELSFAISATFNIMKEYKMRYIHMAIGPFSVGLEWQGWR